MTPKPEHTQAVISDGFDHLAWQTLREDNPAVPQMIQEHSQQLTTFPALAEDLFCSFYRQVPRLRPEAELLPSHRLNHRLQTELFQTREWADLRSAGTVGDDFAAAIAVRGVAGALVAGLDDQTRALAANLHTLESQIQQLLEDVPQNAPDPFDHWQWVSSPALLGGLCSLLLELKRLQRLLSRKVKGSNNRNKQRHKVARLHARIADKRTDFLHKLSTRILHENQVVVVEDLCMKGLGRTRLAKSFQDAGFGKFVSMLEAKAEMLDARGSMLGRVIK